jgi:hypothetical protein
VAGSRITALACCESLAAIDRREGFRSLAAEGSDFDSIRGEPGFKELIAG